MIKQCCYLLLSLVFFLAGCGMNKSVSVRHSNQGQNKKRKNSDPKNNPLLNPGVSVLIFYQKHISAVDSNRCPSYPSCSSYSLQAIQKHGCFMGWLMTVDRLFHEADEGTISPLVLKRGKLKIFDPVQNNDFWWYEENASK